MKSDRKGPIAELRSSSETPSTLASEIGVSALKADALWPPRRYLMRCIPIAGVTCLHPLRRIGMHVRTNAILHEGGKKLAQELAVSQSGDECHTGWVVLEPGIRPSRYTLFLDALTYMRPPTPAVIARKHSRRAQSASVLARRKAL